MLRLRREIITLSVIFLFSPWAFAQVLQAKAPQKFHLATPGQPIAGIPYDEALKIDSRHAEELRQLPGVISVSFMAEGLVVETANPEALPANVEGLPVFATPPLDPDGVDALQKGLPRRSSSPSPPVLTSHPEQSQTVEQIPHPECPLGSHFDSNLGRCAQNTPRPVPPLIKLLPPPPGVIILRPGKVREHAESCPDGFQEARGENSWRFCLDPSRPEVIPPLMVPPINNIPWEKALEIHDRHQQELLNLPGVESVGMGAEGIRVYTSNPDILPKAIEGVPVIPLAPEGPRSFMNHTVLASRRPLHGGISIGDSLGGAVTLTGVALSDGEPWLIFPTHTLSNCRGTPICRPVNQGGVAKLNSCPHFNINPNGGQSVIVQPSTEASNATVVGSSSRWDRLDTTLATTSRDVAAAFMDTDSTEGNGSVPGDRRLESDSTQSPILISGYMAAPVVGNNATIYTQWTTSSGSLHYFTVYINDVNRVFTVGGLGGSCLPQGTSARLRDQTDFIVYAPYVIQPGDSGSPVYDGGGNFIGMVNAGGDGGTVGNGTNAAAIQSSLGFDKWYGTESVRDNTIGVFRPSAARWYVDNGNGKLDATPCTSAAPIATRDQCFGYGATTDVPITGDWDNAMLNSPSNDFTVGAYRPTTDPTMFFVSNTNNPPATVATMTAGPLSFGYKPVSGKWASHGASNVGVFRPSTGGWYLDTGNFFADGCGTDYCFSLAAGMYQAGDTPIAGDWNNDGIVSIGLFRRGIGTAPDYFYLSNINPFTVRFNGTISSWTSAIPGGPGNFGYLPVVGDWTATNQASIIRGWTKLGVFKSTNGGGTAAGVWYLDNGDFSFASCVQDQCPNAFGLSGDKPGPLRQNNETKEIV